MTTGTLHVVIEAGDAATVLRLCGDIDGTADVPLAVAYDDVTSAGVRTVVLDFEHTAYINSSGIAVMVGLLARARAQGVRLSARGVCEHYREIFEITRLADFLTIADTR
jgi:anti-anti-sigma factor